ncbi:hypothetical protein BURKHO8Y_110233 [Burkholderia sp. 8Y]|uniref:hypothetical protein n=1 Tax=Burkholderia sp. 8Y TaxID=2653133 RepID=UPI0012F2B047|nr:hypothetical protein [Burkholderia sp. 8Y]VXB23447.1 hypothetical protein BURKHO8Y_110233 [Burkholderia sp. 8Y]
MTDEEILTTIAAVCDFDRAGVERWRREALIIGRAVERAVLDRAAAVCDGVSVDRWNLYKGRAPYSGSEDGRASDYVQGESDGAEKCAEAIRALLQSEES